MSVFRRRAGVRTREFLPPGLGISLAAFLVLLQMGGGCLDMPEEPYDDWWNGGQQPHPPVVWDPGPKPDPGCSYGYGEPCEPVLLDCDEAPCVHGVCIRGEEEGRGDRCECRRGYAGSRCERCAEGYVAEGLQCLPDTTCSPNPCVFGTCRSTEGGFYCQCAQGYAGRLCDECYHGYEPQGIQCIPIES